jgi:hypothetical protein
MRNIVESRKRHGLRQANPFCDTNITQKYSKKVDASNKPSQDRER